ncbi:WecB/TagA/CpsF family glycosyltransferase [Treponema primitia]|uniref:WecB/TagA/CpsF family glycosyltransferase n=1 Tax=Treponema primitia TaxID=88058 RepID=UPI0002554F44|nr:WecB/TagA/CpsF family glycosyltransferase [Treponema primitia]
MDSDNTAPIERINVLKVPLDIVPQEALTEKVYELLAPEKDGRIKGKHIVLLSLWDLLRARGANEYRDFVQKAALILPISKSLIGGSRFLTGKSPVRYMPFDFIISLLTILENRELSVYLLGAKPRILKKTEKNIRQTFPKLRIVGRFVGNFKRQDENTILEAIRKASPSLLLIGKGVHGGERWIARNTNLLNSGLRLWCSDIFDVFAERKKRPSRAVFDRGLEWFGYCFQHPLRFLRLFPYFYYKILLLIYRVFKKN